MIDKKDCYLFGRILKLHGYSGHVVLKAFSSAKPKLKKAEPVFLEIDGILVPFFTKEFEFISEFTCLLLMEDMESEELAREMIGMDVYLPSSQKPLHKELIEDVTYLLGFKVFDMQFGYVGEIMQILQIPQNHLFLVKEKDKEYLIPASPDFILRTDIHKKEIYLKLPEGLLEI